MTSSTRFDNLAHRASRGVLVTMGGLWTKALIQMGSMIVLARLLAPEDFGLVAMVTAIVGVIDLVRDFGLTGAVIQAREISERMWRSVLWFSIALGAFLMLLVAACSPLIAALYGEDRLVLITLLIAPSLVVNGISMPMQARLTREMGFSALARIDVTSMLTGVVLGISAAIAGWGVWSLVVMAGAMQVSRMISLWIAVRPTFGAPRISRDVFPLIATGANIFGAEFINYIDRNLDNVVVGQQVGAAALGQYSRAYALFLLPMQQMNAPIGRVALPVLSTLQDDAGRYRRYIRGATLVIGYLTFPTYAIGAAVAGPLVAILLGPGWEQAAVIFALLAIAGVAQALGKVRGWLFITLGRSRTQFLYDMFTRPLVFAGFFVGVWWAGVYGLVIIYGVLSLALLIPGYYFAIRRTFVRPGDIVAPVVRPAIASALAFGAAFAATRAVEWADIAELAIGVAAGLAPFLLVLAIPAYRRDIAQILRFAKNMRKPRSAAEARRTADAALDSKPAPDDEAEER